VSHVQQRNGRPWSSTSGRLVITRMFRGSSFGMIVGFPGWHLNLLCPAGTRQARR
jgi:hypothetical protein